MALNAFGMVIQEVAQAASKAAPKMTQKQAQATMRRKRQAQGREQAANRDRQRAANRKSQANKTDAAAKDRGTRRPVDRPHLGTPRDEEIPRPKDPKPSGDDHSISRPEGKVNETAKVKWLNKLEGEEREAREEELLQSLKAAGHYLFKGSAGENLWIEKVEDEDDWNPSYSKSTGDQYGDRYGSVLRRNRSGSVDDMDEFFG